MTTQTKLIKKDPSMASVVTTVIDKKGEVVQQRVTKRRHKHKPSKIRLIQESRRKRVSRQDIVDRCTYIMEQVQKRQKVDARLLCELQQYVKLFNESVT